MAVSKILIQPNPNKKPLLRYDRVVSVQKGQDGRLNEETTEEKEITRVPNTKYSICANLKESTGTLNTGLDVMDDNPYADLKSFRSPDFEAVLKDKPQALRQHILEYKHNKPFNYYTNEINFYKRYTKDNIKDLPFFQTPDASMNLVDSVNTLDLNNPKHEIMYYVATAKGRSDIAPSYQELTGSHSWFISKEEEAAEIKASKKKEKNAAIAKLEEINSKNDGTVTKFCQVLNLARRNMSEPQAYEVLANQLEQSGKKGEFAREEFNNIYKMYKDKVKRDVFNVRALIWEFEAYGVLLKRNTEYTWQPPRDADGKTPDKVQFSRQQELIDYLLDPKHTPELEFMQENLKTRKSHLG